jgi:membrane-associated phospholipid phosphatase
VVLFVIGLVVLAAIASPLTALRAWLVAGMGAAFVTVLAIPELRTFFALVLPPLIVWLVAGVIAAVAAPLVWLLLRVSQREHPPLDRVSLRSSLGVDGTKAAHARDGVERLLVWVEERSPRLLSWVRARSDRTRPHGLPLTVALAAAGVAAWLFADLTQDVLGHDDAVVADPRITSLVVDHRVGWLTVLMRLLSWLGSIVVVVPAALLIGGSLLVRRRDGRPLVMLVAASAGAIILSDTIESAIARPRPPSSIWIGQYGDGAFPSGHATLAVAFSAMLALLLSRGARPAGMALVWFAATLVMLVVGASRVYLGANWLTDVLGGYALGATWVAVVAAIGLLSGPDALVGGGQSKSQRRWAERLPPRRKAA